MTGSYDGKIEIKDNADVSLKGTSGICKFSGDLLVEKDAKLTAISTRSGKAAINMGDSSDSSKAQTITLAGTITVNGFVGIGTSNEGSQIIIDGAKEVNITSTLAGIYPMGGGTVQINKSDVFIDTEQFGIVVQSGTTDFVNSTVEIDAGVMAFHTTVPALTYDNCRTVSAGASQDEAIAIELNEEGVLPSDYTKSKYVKIAPAEHTPDKVATCHSKAVCKVCKQEYGVFDANNHNGETEIRDDLEATYTNAGYTGDTWCLGCNTKIAEGSEIPMLQTYPPTVNSSEGGSVVVAPTAPAAGDTVTITVNSNDGKTLDKIVVTDESNNSVIIKDNGDGTYTFVQPESKVTINVTFKETETPATEETTNPTGTSDTTETTNPTETTATEEPDDTTENTETTTAETSKNSQNDDTTTTSPKTGYDGNLALWFVLLGASVAGMSGAFLYDKRKKYSR